MPPKKKLAENKPDSTGPSAETQIQRPRGRAGSKSQNLNQSLAKHAPLMTPVRRNDSRSARPKAGAYTLGTPMTTRRKKAVPPLNLPPIPSPGSLNLIHEDSGSDVGELAAGLNTLDLGKNTKAQPKSSKKAKAKAGPRANTTARTKPMEASDAEQNTLEIEDAQAIEAVENISDDETEEETASAPEENENDDTGDALSRKQRLTSAQIRLRKYVLEFTKDKEWAESSIWNAKVKDIQDVTNEIEKLAGQGEQVEIFQRMYVLMLQALLFRQAMDDYSDAAEELGLEWGKEMKETVGLVDSGGMGGSEGDPE